MREAVLCFLANPAGVILAEMLRGPFKGHVNGYGGGIEEPDILQAVVREMREECGVRVLPKDIEKAAVIDFHNFKDGEWRKVRVYIGIARHWTGTPCAADGMGPPELFFYNALPLERMLPSDRLWVPRILRGELLEGEIWHNENFTGFVKEPLLQSITKERLVELWQLS